MVEGDVNNVHSREVEIRQVQEDQTKLVESQIKLAKEIQVQIDQLATDVRKALEPPPPPTPPPPEPEEEDTFIPKTKI